MIGPRRPRARSIAAPQMLVVVVTVLAAFAGGVDAQQSRDCARWKQQLAGLRLQEAELLRTVAADRVAIDKAREELHAAYRTSERTKAQADLANTGDKSFRYMLLTTSETRTRMLWLGHAAPSPRWTPGSGSSAASHLLCRRPLVRSVSRDRRDRTTRRSP